MPPALCEVDAVAACRGRAPVEELDYAVRLRGPGSERTTEQEIEGERQEREEACDEAVRPEVALDVEVREFRIADDVRVDVELLG